MKRRLVSLDAPAAVGPYSQGIATETHSYVSGQLPMYAQNGVIEKDISKATALVLKNIESILKVNNMTLSNVVKTTVFMTDLADFAKMNAVYETMFRFPYPARSTIEVSALPKGASLEIECIACIEKPPFVKTI